MKNNEFDKKVQEMFSDFKETYDPNSWESFEKKLESEQEMDDIIKSSLESHREPFNEEHWGMLTAEIERRRQRAVVKRTAEVVIILLLIFTTHNFLQFKGDKSRDTIHLDELKYDFAFLHEMSSNTISLEDEMSLVVDYRENTTEDNAYFTKDKQEIDQTTGSLGSISIKSESPILEKKRASNFNNSGLNETLTSLSHFKGSHQIKPIVSIPKRSDGLKNIDRLSIIPLSDGSVDEFPIFDGPKSFYEDDGKGFWIGIVGGPDVNFINSPIDLNLLKNPISSQSGSMSYGFQVTKDFGLIELSSGIVFSKKSYFPRRIKEFVPTLDQKYLETSLISLDYNQYQIPLLVNVHTPRIGGWGMFGTFGIGTNVITKTFFDVETQLRSLSSVPSQNNKLEIDLIDLPRESVRGGDFTSNVYVSGILGFGIEKRFKNKFAITTTTTYQHSLSNNINPVINRTKQLGITLGAKVNLNKID